MCDDGADTGAAVSVHGQRTLRMDWMVCSGYVTVVATALARALMMKTSREDSWRSQREG